METNSALTSDRLILQGDRFIQVWFFNLSSLYVRAEPPRLPGLPFVFTKERVQNVHLPGGLFNHLTYMSDQDRISPYNNNTISTR